MSIKNIPTKWILCKTKNISKGYLLYNKPNLLKSREKGINNNSFRDECVFMTDKSPAT